MRLNKDTHIYTKSTKGDPMKNNHSNIWRLPVVQELKEASNDPSLNFEKARYWTSREGLDKDFARVFNFRTGLEEVSGKGHFHLVVLVKETPYGLQYSQTSSIELNWQGAFQYADTLEYLEIA